MLRLVLFSFVAIVAFGELYSFWIRVTSLAVARIKQYISIDFSLVESPWFALMVCNLFVAGLSLLISGRLKTLFTIRGALLLTLLPPILVVGGSFLLIHFSGSADENMLRPDVDLIYAVLSCTMVPIVEEVVFRGIVSHYISSDEYPYWSIYFGGLVFSVAHSIPSIERLTTFQVGVPLGPLFLGMISEWLLKKSRSLYPSIAFHCACNSTVVIFSLYGPSWLSRLSMLYS